MKDAFSDKELHDKKVRSAVKQAEEAADVKQQTEKEHNQAQSEAAQPAQVAAKMPEPEAPK